jgi:hypothetical protein
MASTDGKNLFCFFVDKPVDDNKQEGHSSDIATHKESAMAHITPDQTAAMDDTAEWGAANPARVRAAEAVIDSAHASLRKAQAAHAALKVQENVGKYTPCLDYQSVYLPVIREFVTVGFDYSPEEPGDDEQPTIGECFEIQEVWLRGVELGEMAVPYVDELEDSVRAARGAE